MVFTTVVIERLEYWKKKAPFGEQLQTYLELYEAQVHLYCIIRSSFLFKYLYNSQEKKS